eukprot:SAG31_NODE_39273_length_289_cov_1.284211_1_plen_22_part_10
MSGGDTAKSPTDRGSMKQAPGA